MRKSTAETPRVNDEGIEIRPMNAPRPTFNVALVALFLGAAAAYADDVSDYAAAFPVAPDPLMGNWVGRWSGAEKEPEIAAQVIPLGEDRYRIVILNRLDMRSAPYAIVEETASDGTLRFSANTYFGTIESGRFEGGESGTDKRFSMTRVELASPTLNAPPAENAIVLFDGSDLGAWRDTPGWNVTEDGVLLVTPGSRDLVSAGRFTDIQLHIEFRLPYRPALRGQDRGNSGVYLHNAYEVQILDSFGLEGYDDECGAMYKVAAPKVNACRPPLQWQTYDITFTAARISAEGTMEAPARVTVYHNGVPIHTDQELPTRTGGNSKRTRAHPRQAQSLKLQEHEDYIEFRNIWLVDLSEEDG